MAVVYFCSFNSQSSCARVPSFAYTDVLSGKFSSKRGAAVQVTPTQVAVTAPTVNVATAAPAQTPVTAPVSQEVKKYTLPEIQAALAPLLDAGKAVELQQLMAQFGVQYLGEVPEDRYPELVNAIRGLGARI